MGTVRECSRPSASLALTESISTHEHQRHLGRLMQQLADQSALVKQRAGSVWRSFLPARADAGVADLWHRIRTEFHGVLRPVAERLVQLQALADHRDAADGADIVWALNHPDVWQLLSAQRGWTVEHYRSWLAACSATTCSALPLDDGEPCPDGGPAPPLRGQRPAPGAPRRLGARVHRHGKFHRVAESTSPDAVASCDAPLSSPKTLSLDSDVWARLPMLSS